MTVNRSIRHGRALLLALGLAAVPVLAYAVHVVGPERQAVVALTEREKAWIDSHPIIRASNDPGWAPIDFDGPDGMPAGVARELLDLIAGRLDLYVEYVPGQSWREADEALRTRKVDLLLAVTRTPEREPHFEFTAPFMTYRSVIVVREDTPFIPDVSALRNKRFALVAGYTETDRLRERYPALDVMLVSTVSEALQAVAYGRADAAVGNITVMHHALREMGLTNLKVAAPTDDEERRVYFAVREDWPELVGILNKGLAAITREERQRILDRWVDVEFERGLDPAQVWRRVGQAVAGGAVLMLLGLFYLRRLRREIRERRVLQEQLSEARQHVVEIAQGLPGVVYQSVVHADGSGEVRFGRDEYYRLLGLPMTAPAKLDWETLSSVVVEEDRPVLREALVQAVKRQGDLVVDFRVRGQDGAPARWIHIEAVVRRSPEPGILALWNGYAMDVTERKRLEEELAAARQAAEEGSRAKGEFLANMSHEIRTPLNAIIGLSLLATKTNLDSRQRDYVTKISGAAQSLLRIVNDVLDFSKIEAGQLGLEKIRFNIHTVFDDLISIVGHRAAEKGLELRVDVAPELPTHLVGDPLRLSQVLLNLTHNAIKFTQRGHVAVRAQVAGYQGEQVRIRFSVEDTGIGLSREQAGRLFRSFQQADSSTTRQYGGTGLGLSISRKLVELMAGEIGLDSEPGHGSTFWFTVTLPRASAGEEAAVPARHGPAANLRGAHVLLVEDNVINQQVAAELLEGAGVKVDIAANGLEAMRAVRAQHYDAVLMDVQMPVMDGLQATQAIRGIETLKTLPIIAMTASVMRGDRDRCLAAGMNDYVSKPISVDQLLSTLSRWLPPRPPASGGVAADTAPAPEAQAEETPEPAGPPARARPPAAGDAFLPESLPGINLADALKRVSGDKRLYRRLLLQFREHSADAAGQIKAALEAGDRAAARSVAHTLKGVAGNLGAEALYRSAQKLELSLRKGHFEPVSEEAGRLAAAHAEVFAGLAALDAPGAEPATAAAAAPADPETVERLLDDLDQRLAASDAEAGQALQAVKGALNGHSPEVEELERLITAYNFDEARARLARIASSLKPNRG
jgi:signal transduction histidine kinase/CheY-like chemotaxis protein/HPt (histidine-containing phosphotransfer) domain-containing protein